MKKDRYSSVRNFVCTWKYRSYSGILQFEYQALNFIKGPDIEWNVSLFLCDFLPCFIRDSVVEKNLMTFWVKTIFSMYIFLLVGKEQSGAFVRYYVDNFELPWHDEQQRWCSIQFYWCFSARPWTMDRDTSRGRDRPYKPCTLRPRDTKMRSSRTQQR